MITLKKLEKLVELVGGVSVINRAAFLWFMEIGWEYAYFYASMGINLCICIYLCFFHNILSKAKTYTYAYIYAFFYMKLVWKKK